MAVIDANTGFVVAANASLTDKPAVADVMKAHTGPAAVACAVVGARGELILKGAAAFAVPEVVEDAPAVIATAAAGTTLAVAMAMLPTVYPVNVHEGATFRVLTAAAENLQAGRTVMVPAV